MYVLCGDDVLFSRDIYFCTCHLGSFPIIQQFMQLVLQHDASVFCAILSGSGRPQIYNGKEKADGMVGCNKENQFKIKR